MSRRASSLCSDHLFTERLISPCIALCHSLIRLWDVLVSISVVGCFTPLRCGACLCQKAESRFRGIRAGRAVILNTDFYTLPPLLSPLMSQSTPVFTFLRSLSVFVFVGLSRSLLSLLSVVVFLLTDVLMIRLLVKKVFQPFVVTLVSLWKLFKTGVCLHASNIHTNKILKKHPLSKICLVQSMHMYKLFRVREPSVCVKMTTILRLSDLGYLRTVIN